MTAAVITRRWKAGRETLLRATGPVPLSRWAWTADALLGVLLAASVLLYTTRAGHGLDGRDVVTAVPTIPRFDVGPVVRQAVALQPWELLLATLCALPLIVRRRYPLTALVLVFGATLLFHTRVVDADTALFTFAACLIAAYSALVYSPHRRLSVAGVVTGAGLIAAFHDNNVPDITAGYVPFLLIVAIGVGANSIHTWKQRVRSLELQQETATRLAVEGERSRIARELHDVVTHNVSVMVIQAGAARKVMEAEPGQAREALLAVEAGGRAALSELRSVMHLLTASGEDQDTLEDDDLVPQPGLGQLGVLVDRVRDSGVPIELTVTGTPTSLPAGVDLAAYRVVQEGVTNAVKHAAGAPVRVTVEYATDELRVEVADVGGSPFRPVGRGEGRGLIGLRERLALVGGTLEAGARLTGGYRVRAVLPLEVP